MKIRKVLTGVTAIAVAVIALVSSPPTALANAADAGQVAGISEVQAFNGLDPADLTQEGLALHSVAGAFVTIHQEAIGTGLAGTITTTSLAAIGIKDCTFISADNAFPAAAPPYAIPVTLDGTADLVAQARAGDIPVPGDVEMNC